MNTRTKIVSQEDLPALLAGAPAILVVGSFDPMLAALAMRLHELAGTAEGKLVAAVCDAPEPVLSLESRLEMTAAVAVVDFVLPYSMGLETLCPWTAIYDDTALHNRWCADFQEHVRRRSQSASF